MIDISWYRRPRDVKLRFAAGGVVVRQQGAVIRVALCRQHNRSMYLLPKGGVERGESLEEAARREIAEEAGFTDLRLLLDLGSRSRLNYSKTTWGTTHYFLFLTTQQRVLPLEPEKHDPPDWFDLDDLPPILWPDQTQLVIENRDRIRMAVATMADSRFTAGRVRT